MKAKGHNYRKLSKYIREQLDYSEDMQKDEVVAQDMFLKGRYYALKELINLMERLRKTHP